MGIEDILRQLTRMEVSDIFLVAGRPISYKMNREIRTLGEERLTPALLEEYIRDIYRLAGEREEKGLLKTGDDDFSFALQGLARFRVSTFGRGVLWRL